MASDKQQVDRMEAHRAGLLEEGKLSYPSSSGRIAIITMYDPAKLAEMTRREDQPETLDAEARRIRAYLRWRGRNPVYLPDATMDDLWDVLDDVRVSDLVLIALAHLSRVHTAPWARPDNPDKEQRMASFFDAVSRTGTRPTVSHLKAGSFYQRTSGQMHVAPLNVPFGWGFMADRARIWGLPRLAFYPSPRHVRPGAGLVNLAGYFQLDDDDLRGVMPYERTKEIFGRREQLPFRRYRIPEFAYPVYDRLKYSERVHRFHDGIRRSLGAEVHGR